ncbi:helix-turn-helix transcriptional regulator [Thiopseudomonas denitrificans]|uniref:AlpA family transcriptional regulator n=1 Tax=Thiopseudomonas denitrificans TaxID=1501432 RepID=A0A4R6TW84_9GAMM|nr:AlpA family transcriptional regulator [Thiopseudomonas denitrificans]TDQ38098.1 AlpA family transcriptional regulator [Thiopseudomonas denitrificans]
MKFIKLRDVMELTSLARSTIYKFVAEGRFPKQVPLGGNCVAWVESEIHEWLEGRIAERDSTRE